MRVSNACKFRLLVYIFGDESIRLVRLCLQVETSFNNKRLCFVTICLNREALTSIFKCMGCFVRFYNSTHTNEWFHII